MRKPEDVGTGWNAPRVYRMVWDWGWKVWRSSILPKEKRAAQVRQCVAEVIDLADQDVLGLMRSRAAEQDVLDLLDEPTSR